jgi:hypothetical protein
MSRSLLPDATGCNPVDAIQENALSNIQNCRDPRQLVEVDGFGLGFGVQGLGYRELTYCS